MKDAIIVGGGLLGMLTTRMLHAAGLDVMIIDQNELGKESTWAGGGIVSPLYPWRYPAAVSRLALYSQRYYPQLCAELQAETSIDPQWQRSGLLFTDDNEITEAQAWAQQYGYHLEHLQSAQAMQDCEVQVSDTFERGLFFPELGQVRNPRISYALRSSLRLKPVTIAEYAKIQGIVVENGRVTGVRSGNDVFKANKVIITAGAWSGLFPELQAMQVKVSPVLGQMIMFRGPRGLLNRIVLHEGRYLIPRNDGRILCGSTLEMNGFDKRTSDEAREALRESACEIMPALKDIPLTHHWAGLRPGSPNGVPYIAEHPEIEGLYVNTGHYRNGVVLGLASVQLLTDLILGRQPCVDPIPYRLSVPRIPTAEFA